MRLGKTLLAIWWAKSRSPNGRKLVVAPRDVLVTAWVLELAREEEDFIFLEGASLTKINQLARSEAEWVLVNPEGIRAAPGIFSLHGWDVIILDESTLIANARTQTSKLFLKFRGFFPNRAILSGCPAPESPLQYFQQMAFLESEFMGCRNYWQFRALNFIPPDNCSTFQWEPFAGAEKRILTAVAERAFTLRTEDVDLPFAKRVYESRTITCPSTLQNLSREVAREYRLGDRYTKWKIVTQIWLARIAGGFLPAGYSPQLANFFKVEVCREIIDTEFQGKAVVVCCRFLTEIRALTKAISGAKPVYGALPPEVRRSRYSAFQKGKIRVLVVQHSVVRFGIDLSRASAMIFYSNPWDLQTRLQLEARIEHPRRTEPPLYLDLLTRGTIDTRVRKALRSKDLSSSERMRMIRSFFWEK
jgi:hypothetical protein